MKLNNAPQSSKFTIPSPHLHEKRHKFSEGLKVRFEDLADMQKDEKEEELNKEEQIAIQRSIARKLHEEQRRQRIREK